MNPGKATPSLIKGLLLFSLLLHWGACEHSPDLSPQPLLGFYEKVTALTTTTVRGQLRDHPPRQQLLSALLPALEQGSTMNELTEILKGTGLLRDLAYLIETDVMFELQKPEHHYERVHFNSPEIQRQIVSAILGGMKRALDQVKGGRDAR
ncbi:MAG: hypothetical protein N3G78_03650 [Desulfobacterota bacterium]|nr:hypothetical protein [Thermodesulfobacteriota bacterium]